MNTTLKSITFYIQNKSISFIVLALSIVGYGLTPRDMPFSELAYTAITVFGVLVLAPIGRLLVFNEAAAYAECGQLDKDIAAGKFTPALIHYWFATAISYLVPLACVAGIAK